MKIFQIDDIESPRMELVSHNFLVLKFNKRVHVFVNHRKVHLSTRQNINSLLTSHILIDFLRLPRKFSHLMMTRNTTNIQSFHQCSWAVFPCHVSVYWFSSICFWIWWWINIPSIDLSSSTLCVQTPKNGFYFWVAQVLFHARTNRYFAV